MDHNEIARRAWPMLVKRALAREPTTYGEIAGILGIHHRSARFFLEAIQQCCLKNNMPKLTALVVSKQFQKPGSGYHWSDKDREDHAKDLNAVYDFGARWPMTAPPPL